jgi:addiction module HigA family antidote
MARKRTLQPVNAIHPGEMLLEEFLLPAGKTQTAFARDVGWTRARVNEFIKGKRGVTAEAALDMAESLGTSPRLWMNLQATFDLEEATRKRRAA